VRHVDAESVPAELFGLSDELGRVDGDWHAHTRHQLLYARSGTLRLEVHDAAWVLPPRRAAWIRAGVVHRVSVKRSVSLCTMYVDRRRANGPDAAVGVFPVTDLGREMILHAMRWGPGRDPDDPVAEAFFGAVVALLAEWTAEDAPYGLPRGRSDTTRAAIRWTFARLDDRALSVDGAARAAGTSARTLRRRMLEETGQSWRDLVQQARLLRAVEALSDPASSVQQACDAAGYQSLGTFSRSFSEALGESPRAWQRRATGP
jgi:AraC-like DNA-binding protein